MKHCHLQSNFQAVKYVNNLLYKLQKWDGLLYFIELTINFPTSNPYWISMHNAEQQATHPQVHLHNIKVEYCYTD